MATVTRTPKTAHPGVAAILRQARDAAGKNQRALAIRLGISQQGYSCYETGRSGIPLRNLHTICIELGLSFAEVVALYRTREEPPSRSEEECVNA